ncbi:zinc finger, C3HC4 type [Opisthorchis viverrini]|uniref:Zinc finger, C3HC4 type n=1 Tax=Opisthorchis viverrini TaxID=6198 RepID=A0A1S8WGH1_OPIVI|nr:zinc finger, C3HC4 type [Opisthorchis viverrini]
MATCGTSGASYFCHACGHETTPIDQDKLWPQLLCSLCMSDFVEAIPVRHSGCLFTGIFPEVCQPFLRLGVHQTFSSQVSRVQDEAQRESSSRPTACRSTSIGLFEAPRPPIRSSSPSIPESVFLVDGTRTKTSRKSSSDEPRNMVNKPTFLVSLSVAKNIMRRLHRMLRTTLGPAPASKQQMSNLTTFELSVSEAASSGQCVICLEAFQPATLCIKLPCEHVYHHDCAQQWLLQHGLCPLCRKDLDGNVIQLSDQSDDDLF